MASSGPEEGAVLVALAWLTACKDDPTGKDGSTPTEPVEVDGDGDGYTVAEDCDDDAANVNPGVVDLAYDGLDQDCAGDDDFDVDQDGSRSDDHGGDDCNDANAEIGPDAPEVPYNATDDDCDPTTPDDDLDQDGFLQVQDCDDTDAERYPGALERPFDPVDGDCDGNADSAPFALDPVLYTALGQMRAVDTDAGVVIGVTATTASGGALFPEPVDGVAVLVTLPHDLVGGESRTLASNLLFGEYEPDPLGGFDLEADGDGLVAGLAWFSTVNSYGYAGLKPLGWVPTFGWFPGDFVFSEVVLQQWSTIDAARVGSEMWAAAGSLDGLTYVTEDGVSGTRLGVDAALGVFVDGTRLVGCSGSDCVSHDVVPGSDPVPSAAQPHAGADLQWVRAVGGQRTSRLADRGLHWTDDTDDALAFDGEYVLDGQVLRVGTELWSIGVLARGLGAELRLARGPVGGPYDETIVPLGGSVTPIAAAIAVTSDRVFVLVATRTAAADQLGWSVLAR